MILQNSKIFKVSIGTQKFFGFCKVSNHSRNHKLKNKIPYTIYGMEKKKAGPFLTLPSEEIKVL
jgi:hypothetical protein